MQKVFISTFLIVFSPLWLNAQITGKVVDHFGNPLADVNITALHHGAQTLSLANGTFVLQMTETPVGIFSTSESQKSTESSGHLYLNSHNWQLEANNHGQIFNIQGQRTRHNHTSLLRTHTTTNGLRKNLLQADTLVFEKEGFLARRIEVVEDTLTLSDVVLEAELPETYTLTYHLNGGTGAIPQPQSIAYSTSLTHLGQSSLQGPIIRDGISQRFLGWKTQADGSGQNAQSSMPAADYDLYAIWTQDDSVLGKIGPAGGVIIYERPTVELTEGYEWRYLEAAPSEGTTEVNWARVNTSVSTQISIGAGYTNSQNLATTLGSDAYAHRRAIAPTYSSTYLGQSYTDFYLPSLLELEEMYKYRSFLNGVAINKYYWSSSESSFSESSGVKSKAYRVWMGTGAPSDHPKNSTLYSNVTRALVRAIRRF